jgi:hypothetical protein
MKLIPGGFAAKPTVAEDIKQQCIDLLRKALQEAEAGEVVSAFVILKRPDHTWSDERSGTMDFPDAIGRLEIVKQSWIRHYLAPDE